MRLLCLILLSLSAFASADSPEERAKALFDRLAQEQDVAVQARIVEKEMLKPRTETTASLRLALMWYVTRLPPARREVIYRRLVDAADDDDNPSTMLQAAAGLERLGKLDAKDLDKTVDRVVKTYSVKSARDWELTMNTWWAYGCSDATFGFRKRLREAFDKKDLDYSGIAKDLAEMLKQEKWYDVRRAVEMLSQKSLDLGPRQQQRLAEALGALDLAGTAKDQSLTMAILGQVADGLFSSNPARKKALLARGADGTFVASVKKAMLNDYAETFRVAAFPPEALKPFGTAPELLRDALARYEKERRDAKDRFRSFDFFEKFEAVRDTLSPGERARLDEALDVAFAAPARGKDDACAAVCHLVEKRKEWLKDENFKKLPQRRAPLGWEMGIRSLGYLFLAKAAPFCGKEGEAARREIIDAITTDDWEKKRKDVLALKRPIEDTGAMYSKFFFPLLVRELSAQKALAADQDKRLRRTAAETEESLREDLKRFKEALGSFPEAGSLFNNFAVGAATASIASPPASTLEYLDEIAKLAGEGGFPYSDGHSRETLRGGAARGMTMQWARLAHEIDDARRKTKDEELRRRADTMMKWIVPVRLHVRGGYVHTGPDGLAPYYFYPNLAFATGGLRYLGDEKKLARSRDEILALRLDTGLFTTHAENDMYGISSRSYNNALAGLALIPTIDSCSGRAVTPSLGIVERNPSPLVSAARPRGEDALVHGERTPRPAL